MEQIVKPYCGTRLDRLSDCHWHTSMFVTAASGLPVCWSNTVGGLILAQLKELGWTDSSTIAMFSAITIAGMFPGALGGGVIGDKTGRKNVFILYEAIHIISVIVDAFSPNMTFLITCRFVIGVGLGVLLVILFAGFTGYMPGGNRSTWSNWVSFIGNWSYPLCSPIAMGLAPLISAEWNWHVQSMIPAVLPLVATITAWRSSPESSRRSESRGHYAEAEKVMWAIKEGVVQQTDKPLPPVISEDDGKVLHTVPYSALLTGVLLKRIILSSFVLIAMDVAQYTLINQLPTIFMIQRINLEDSIVLNTTSMLDAPSGISIAILVMDKVSRKAMGVGLLVLIAVLGYTYSSQTSMLLIMLVGFFLITFVYTYARYASVVYVPETWPTEARLRGPGLASAAGHISGITASYAVAVLLSGYGVTDIFVLLGAILIIIAVAIATIGIGTKGVSVESLGIDTIISK